MYLIWLLHFLNLTVFRIIGLKLELRVLAHRMLPRRKGALLSANLALMQETRLTVDVDLYEGVSQLTWVKQASS